MNPWWARLLGMDAESQAPLRPEQIFFVRMWPLALVVLALLGMLAWTFYWYRRDGTRPGALFKTLMGALRLLAMALLLFMAFQPMLRSQRQYITRSVVAVLLDVSESMSRYRDHWVDARKRQETINALGGSPTAARQPRLQQAVALLGRPQVDLLNQLEKTHRVLAYTFGSEARPLAVPRVTNGAQKGRFAAVPLPTALNGQANSTQVGAALEHVLAETAGQPVAGVIVLSDGGQNMGPDPVIAARRAAENRIPIYTAGFGDPNDPRDLAVVNILADEIVRKGDEVVVQVVLRQRKYEGATVPLVLRLGQKELGRAELRLENDLEVHSFAFIPEQTGLFKLTASVPVQPGETNRNNNTRSFNLRIIDKKLKILAIEGEPRWEFRYLKNAILRDKTVHFACLLADGELGSGGEGNVKIFGFPRDRKELFSYDLILLGDVPRGFFTSVDLENIVAFVEQRGGSLIVIAGENAMPWQYRGEKLAEVLPVLIPPYPEQRVFREPFQVQLTDKGRDNPMMWLAADPQESAQIWQRLPGVYWCGLSDGRKRSAEVLATHPSIRKGPEGELAPLMLHMNVGNGRVFMSLVDSTWQWRFAVGDKYFYRFWAQIIRTMKPQELPGADAFTRITTDQNNYVLGQKARITARLLTPNYQPVRQSEVRAEVRRQNDGQAFPLRLEPVIGNAGSYSTEWLLPLPGDYRLSVVGYGGRKTEGLRDFNVEVSSIELDEPALKEQTLRQIAEISGGAYVPLTEVGRLPDRIPDASQRLQSRLEHELWDTPLLLILFSLFLVGEWALRKWKGLL
ncbi:MAG: VWA domain-containing protein [Armatimonadetes bacterium]|nr:VWA domain-containing protein [Armatimonadota bacterium]